AYIAIPAGNDTMWKRFCTAIGRDDLIDHPKFSTNKDRTDNIDELIPILEEVMAQKTVAEWVDIFEQAQFPCSPINTIDKTMQHPQVLARNMIVDVEDADIGTVKISGNPIKMSSLPEENTRPPAPEVGEHNAKIFKDLLGYSDAEIEQLQNDGVI
ncbi:CoA transferase, partial [candidate division KSB3 bacterium]|nr:CoA transferase [candidate division KSB3 bacterium]